MKNFLMKSVHHPHNTMEQNIFCMIISMYMNSLLNAAFGSGKKTVLTEFCINKQVKWNQFIKNEVKCVLEKEFLFLNMC